MNAEFLARLQFAITIGFHYIFPPITIGLAWLIFYLLTVHKKNGLAIFEDAARFWIKMLAATFAVGVATGITMEFQFGTNWASYVRFVGDVFGAPLAAEAIFAFFMESTFIAVLIFGWGRVGKNTMWFASLMVALGATLSAFWIIVANSWMQTPAGYHMVGGRAELLNFWQAVFNPSTLPRFLHTVVAAVTSGAFFMLGLSAWMLLKKSDAEFIKRSLKVALVVAFAGSVLQIATGHYHAIQVANTQPEKFATIEGVEKTEQSASAIIFGIPNEKERTINAAVRVPGLLSILLSGRTEHEVRGMEEFPPEDMPPLTLTFLSFHLMVALGFYFVLFSGLGIFLLAGKKIFALRSYLWLAVLTIPLPIVANELGWISAEVGRQPWAVYRVLKTVDAVSTNVSANSVLGSIAAFSVIYLLLFMAWIIVIRKLCTHFNQSGSV